MQTLSDIIVANPAATDVEIVGLFNEQPDRWQPVRSKYVLAWLGEAGRLIKLEGFIAVASADAQVVGLQSAVKTVLLAVANPDTELLLDPGSPHRVMLAALVTATALTQDDADALVARGKVVEDATTDAVAAVRSLIARSVRMDQWRDAKSHADAKASAIIDADPVGDIPAIVAAASAAYTAELAARMAGGAA